MRILVVGASGYIGGRLATLLLARGDDVVLTSRDARPLEDRFPGATVLAADLLEPASLPAVLDGVQIAYYLADSMGGGERGFSERDRMAAGNFARAAAAAGIQRIVYLGGLGDDEDDLSRAPLQPSRDRRGARRPRSVPVTELRAAVIIGSGRCVVRDAALPHRACCP